jgi:hypothetical protein
MHDASVEADAGNDRPHYFYVSEHTVGVGSCSFDSVLCGVR